FRNPALAAMELATLARLFPGRFVPVAGHGVQAWMEQVGARAESPMTLLREWVTAGRALPPGGAGSGAGAVREPGRRRAGLAAGGGAAAARRRPRTEDRGVRRVRRGRPGARRAHPAGRGA